MMKNGIEKVVNDVLDELPQNKDRPILFQKSLLKLYFLLGPELKNALSIVDKNGVTILTTLESENRQVYQVKGSKSIYTLLPNSPSRCSCKVWRENVFLGTSTYRTAPFCRHILAAVISLKLKTFIQRNISKEVYIDIIAQMN